jgi:regulator of protease activity HflC (stomatin/prohibitin superfamily)
MAGQIFYLLLLIAIAAAVVVLFATRRLTIRDFQRGVLYRKGQFHKVLDPVCIGSSHRVNSSRSSTCGLAPKRYPGRKSCLPTMSR